MKGLIEIFYEPGKVFDYVRERGAWAIALIANIILILFTSTYATHAIGPDNIARHQLETSRMAASMTPEQKETAAQAALSPTRQAITGAAVVVVTIVIFVIFGLLNMAIAGVSGSPIKFGQAMGVTVYSSWPLTLLRTLLSVVVIMMAADKADLDPQHLLAFNAGAFLDKATTSKFVYSLASSIDLLTFATMLLGAYGLARVAKIAFSRALVGLILIWIVFSFVGAGLASLF